jgi:hypothetical protein
MCPIWLPLFICFPLSFPPTVRCQGSKLRHFGCDHCSSPSITMLVALSLSWFNFNHNCSYVCKWPKKLLITKSDLVAKIERKIFTNLTTKCEANGTYDLDITSYTCTKPCPLPKIPDPSIVTHNWTVTTENSEYRDVIRYYFQLIHNTTLK